MQYVCNMSVIKRSMYIYFDVFPQVGGAYSYDCSFGYIPNVELMKFISMATFGSYLSMCPESGSTGDEMNAYHRAFLTYSFLRTGESMNPEYCCCKLNTDTPERCLKTRACIHEKS